ncbi:ATP-binding cassette domain-containing protein, partial [Eubacterium aggregans]|uniref:ATP-binding cassette domain-containing protein n=1 Tax=Eubacterium aggregans TaxID=81409 RepID=UPI003F31E988
MAIFDFKNLTFSYPEAEKHALQEINLSIEQGEFIVLCGASLCGKSTLLHHFKTVLTPNGDREGERLFNGVPSPPWMTAPKARKLAMSSRARTTRLSRIRSGMSWPSAWKAWATTTRPFS